MSGSHGAGCVMCPRGTYKPGTTAPSQPCTACGPGMTTTRSGATSPEECGCDYASWGPHYGTCTMRSDGLPFWECSRGAWGKSCNNTCPGGTGDAQCHGQGDCDDGIDGTGTCQCIDGVWGQECQHACPGGTGVDQCYSNGHCDDGVDGTGECASPRGPLLLKCFKASSPAALSGTLVQKSSRSTLFATIDLPECGAFFGKQLLWQVRNASSCTVAQAIVTFRQRW